MLNRMVAAGVLALLASPSIAAPPDPVTTSESTAPVFGKWWCLNSARDLASLSYVQDEVSINNFAAHPRVALFTDAPMVEITASVVNRSEFGVSVSVEYVGHSEGALAFAVSAAPPLAFQPGSNQVLRGEVIVNDAASALQSPACIRVNRYLAATEWPR